MSDGDWPYPDLKLRSPNCPLCGDIAKLMVGANLHPIALCQNEDCRAWMWDPSLPAAVVLDGARDIEIETNKRREDP